MKIEDIETLIGKASAKLGSKREWFELRDKYFACKLSSSITATNAIPPRVQSRYSRTNLGGDSKLLSKAVSALTPLYVKNDILGLSSLLKDEKLFNSLLMTISDLVKYGVGFCAINDYAELIHLKTNKTTIIGSNIVSFISHNKVAIFDIDNPVYFVYDQESCKITDQVEIPGITRTVFIITDGSPLGENFRLVSNSLISAYTDKQKIDNLISTVSELQLVTKSVLLGNVSDASMISVDSGERDFSSLLSILSEDYTGNSNLKLDELSVASPDSLLSASKQLEERINKLSPTVKDAFEAYNRSLSTKIVEILGTIFILKSKSRVNEVNDLIENNHIIFEFHKDSQHDIDSISKIGDTIIKLSQALDGAESVNRMAENLMRPWLLYSQEEESRALSLTPNFNEFLVNNEIRRR